MSASARALDVRRVASTLNCVEASADNSVTAWQHDMGNDIGVLLTAETELSRGSPESG
ncbi:hypothetical protein I550_2763 [Mycobacterium intracellulare 1956]|uniref:Uncharacterized protein n=1 Tax=Mycobacterium intracellulare 1956 TaxID=1299331 RepID=X8CWK2_MYCIT|nr:hypothetical protein I550_2763 [Mycobacterium intracellulare 1956]